MLEEKNKLNLKEVEWLSDNFPFNNSRGPVEDCYLKILTKLYVKKYAYTNKMFSWSNQGYFKKCDQEDIFNFVKGHLG